MNRKLADYVKKVKLQKKQRKRVSAFFAAMSLMVTCSVSWQLHSIGTAMVDDTLPAASDNSILSLAADSELFETPSSWEATLPDVEGLSTPESIALVAESQIGYKENTLNFVEVDKDGDHKCYSRYGEWYGNPYGEWNTMFTYFCMKYGGVDESQVPIGSGCWAWTVELDKRELIIPVSRGSPQRGAIVFFDNDLDGKADHSAIVTSVSDEEQSFTAVVGNVDGEVAEVTYDNGDDTIFGYLIVPEGKAASSEKNATGPGDDQEQRSENTSDAVQFREYSESGIEVIASADKTAFPEGTEMSVTDISAETAMEAAEMFDIDMLDAVAVDISFSDSEGNEIEPSEDSSVQVQIILPDEAKLQGDEYSLFHIADNGDVKELEEAEVSESGAEFTAESFSIYVLTSGEYVDKDQAFIVNGQPVPNSSDTPYAIRVGDSFTLRTKAEKWNDGQYDQGFPFGYDSSILRQTSQSYLPDEYQDGKTIRVVDTTYQVIGVGSTAITLVEDSSEVQSHFYVNGVESPQIYVETALGERHKDEVHEYLAAMFGDWYRDHPDDFVTINVNGNNVPKYVKNRDSSNNGSGYTWMYSFKPYCVSSGDTIELVSYVPANKAGDYSFSSVSQGSHRDVGSITVENHPDQDIGNGMIRKTATVTAAQVSSKKNSCVQLGNEYFYISISANDVEMSHADIEIDDGGSYTIIKEKIKDGKKVTEKYIYSAQVSKVNTCKIYTYNEETGQFEPLKVIGRPTVNVYVNQSGETEARTFQSEHYGEDVIFYTDDYYNLHDADSQASQYEWTSNYVDREKYPHDPSYQINYFENNKVYLRDANPATNKNFLLGDAQKAVFDVELELDLKEAYSISDDGTITDISSTAPATRMVDSMEFSLDRKDILDAYNKCPFHSGLDFTLAANAVMVDFEMKKEMTGADFRGGEFTFELLNDDGTSTGMLAVNNEEGIIQFENLYFDSVGEYKYKVVEQAGDDPNIIYDTVPHEITVIVSQEGERLVAEISDEQILNTFKNYQQYKLPATGGTGIIPHLIIGTIFISGASMLLVKTRRKREA
ncbi:MAG: hypothetical protein IKI56_08655 [Ruminococcus sp.]|nr:hypothetical protein [Ruminococcus sp.]